MKEKSPSMSVEYVRSALTYDPETGLFCWFGRRSKIKPGMIAGRRHTNGYVYIKLDGKNFLAHRLAWFWMTGAWPTDMIDHRDNDKSNNRWVNLRQANRSQNKANGKRYSNNKSGYKGVTKELRCERWRAEIRVNRKLLYLGMFKTKEEAALAYRRASERNFGEFALP